MLALLVYVVHVLIICITVLFFARMMLWCDYHYLFSVMSFAISLSMPKYSAINLRKLENVDKSDEKIVKFDTVKRFWCLVIGRGVCSFDETVLRNPWNPRQHGEALSETSRRQAAKKGSFLCCVVCALCLNAKKLFCRGALVASVW